MTKVNFETSTLASATTKAAHVAPTKGAAFDKSAGILMEIDPASLTPIVIKATDLEVTYREEVNSLTIEGDKSEWRLPSSTFAGVMAGFPLGTETVMRDDGGLVHLACGKTKAKLPTISGLPFADFEKFDEKDLNEVKDFSAKVAQVSWACDRAAIPFTGVHIDGTHVLGCDRYRLARVPCEAPVTEPITVPLEVLRPILKNLKDAKLKATDKRLLLMPDDFTQVTAVIFDAKYPDLEKIMRRDYPRQIPVDKEQFRTVVHRMLVLVRGERYPVMRLTIGDGVIKVFMNVEGVGEMEDEISAADADHDPFEVYYTPANFLDGLTNASKPEVKYSYDPTNALAFAFFEDGEGYESWIVPRKNMSE